MAGISIPPSQGWEGSSEAFLPPPSQMGKLRFSMEEGMCSSEVGARAHSRAAPSP